MAAVQETVDRVRRIDVDQYRYGFETLIESDKAPKGLSEDTIRFISAKKNEPAWMLEWRLEAYRRWLTMVEPHGRAFTIPRSITKELYYYSAPKKKKELASLDEVDPEILRPTKSSHSLARSRGAGRWSQPRLSRSTASTAMRRSLQAHHASSTSTSRKGMPSFS